MVYHESQSSKKLTPAPKERALKMKKLEAEDDKGRSRMRDGEQEGNPPKCKFFLTSSGCKKGKDCKFSHDQKDDQRRCYICGSSEHVVPGCPRRKADQPRQPPKAARIEANDEHPRAEETTETSTTTEEKPGEPTVKGLLEEATKVLKSISTTSTASSRGSQPPQDRRDEMMANLQKQLDQLRLSGSSGSLKVLRLSRMSAGTSMGLIDSGATHPLRPLYPSEDASTLKSVEVTLADGNKRNLMMTREGTMVTSSKDIEPIVPMGILISKLKCEVTWTDNHIVINHPRRGDLEVTCVDGCPMIKRALALELIEEAEKSNIDVGLRNLHHEKEASWMKQLVEAHPVLSQLPGHIKQSLAVDLGDWKDIPVNKRLRKRFKRDGFTVHLFAGKDEGQTLKKTFHQLGGEPENILELDILRDQRHDFLSNNGVYGGLIRAALDNRLLTILGGPNCRTRSVLRHRPIEGQVDYPKPMRSWEDAQIYGLHNLSQEDRKKVEEDDIMLWRMIFLFMIATYVNQANNHSKPIGFLLEQPASPRQYQPDCVSLWDQTDWKSIADEFRLQHCAINQGDFGGAAVKPRTFANNIDLIPTSRSKRPKSLRPVNDSKLLSRWAPGIMQEIALALKNQIYKTCGSIRALSWKDHVDHNHVPFRRDCRVCQESLQRELPHRKVKHPMCGVLSADTSGPFHLAPDVVGNAKYMLVATLTWVVPKSSTLKEADDGEDPLPLEAPVIECEPDEDEEGEHEPSGDRLNLFEDDQEEEKGHSHPTGALGNGEEPTRDSSGGGEPALEGRPCAPKTEPLLEELPEDFESEPALEGGPCAPKTEPLVEELPENFEIRTYRMALPMSSKASGEVMQTILEIFLRLKADGFVVSRFHSDRGREFSNQLRKWFTSRGVICTRTSGDNPQANGRSEVAVQGVKTLIRRTLLQASAGPELWPWALRYLNECFREARMDKALSFPPFLQKVMVNKRTWKNRQFESVKEEVSYLCPAWADHGHWVRKDGENPTVTRFVLHKLETPPTEAHWVALEREVLDPIAIRRRIRGKTTIRNFNVAEGEDQVSLGEEEQAGERHRVLKVIEEEMLQFASDEPEVAVKGLRAIAKLKKFVSIATQEEEVLQTRIISPMEVNQHWEEWRGPATDQVRSMLEEKQALRPVKKKELEEIMRKAKEKNRKVELIPSKLVFIIVLFGPTLAAMCKQCAVPETHKASKATLSF